MNAVRSIPSNPGHTGTCTCSGLGPRKATPLTLRLEPRVGLIAEVLFLPPLAFAFLVYATFWIYRGFRISATL